MDVTAIDHVNLNIPGDEIETAIEFYGDVLGLPPENLDRFENGDKSFFSFRISEETVVHVRPVDDFEPPNGNAYNHVALFVEDAIEAVKREFEANGVVIDDELREPVGARGAGPAVYVTDPFGYSVEITATE